MNGKIISLSKEHLNIIVAFTDKNMFISNQNELPWKMCLKGDMKFVNKFIRLEPNSVLIVGRQTYESIPKYKDVNVIVVTSTPLKEDGTKHFKKFEDAVEYAKSQNLFIIIFGGVGIYKEALRSSYRLFCTIVKEGGGALTGDRQFPKVDIPMTNITKDVNQFLLDNKVQKSWDFNANDGIFEENIFKYSFFFGESKV